MAYCVNCGQQIPDGASFCTNCGASQTTHMQSPEQNAAPYSSFYGGSASGTDYSYTGGYDAGQSSYSAGQGGYDAGQSSYNSAGGYDAGQGGYNSAGGYGAGQSSYNSAGGYGAGQSSYNSAGGYDAGQGGYSSMGGAPTPGMSFVEAVQTCVTKKYATFSGRARRSEYWYYTLFSILVSLVTSVVGGALFVHSEGDVNILSALASIALFLPGLGVAIRRLHDIGKSGWWYLILLVPFIGWIVLLIFLCRDSDRGPNRFGPSPKYPG